MQLLSAVNKRQNGIPLDQLDPLRQSALERRFVTRWRQFSDGAPDPLAEYKFNEDRKFRFAWPAHQVAIELHGIKDHTMAKELTQHCEKMNQAQAEGWVVFQATTRMLGRNPAGIIEMILGALDAAYIKAGNANRARMRADAYADGANCSARQGT